MPLTKKQSKLYENDLLEKVSALEDRVRVLEHYAQIEKKQRTKILLAVKMMEQGRLN